MDAQLAGMPLLDQPLELTPGAAVLERARGGDIAAFRELLRGHQARVFSIALRLTGRRADAEELAQDVFLKLHAVLADIESHAHLRHWLLRTVTHRCIDRLRSQARRPQLVPLAALAEADTAAPESAGDPLMGARLRQLLLQLAPDPRAVVLLRFQEDLDPAEIALLLGMSVNTVKSHLRRSLHWLRAQLPGDGNGS